MGGRGSPPSRRGERNTPTWTARRRRKKRRREHGTWCAEGCVGGLRSLKRLGRPNPAHRSGAPLRRPAPAHRSAIPSPTAWARQEGCQNWALDPGRQEQKRPVSNLCAHPRACASTKGCGRDCKARKRSCADDFRNAMRGNACILPTCPQLQQTHAPRCPHKCEPNTQEHDVAIRWQRTVRHWRHNRHG